MLNLIIWKKVQGQKHPGMWGIVEHQIPSIKVLLKTNAESHKHPGIKLSSSEGKTLVNQRKQNSYRRANIYIYYHRASGRQQSSSGGTHIIQSTGFSACSLTCCQWDGEDVTAPWERSNSHPPVWVQKSCVNQFIQYNICSRGVFAVNNSKLRNCVIVAIECFCNDW